MSEPTLRRRSRAPLQPPIAELPIVTDKELIDFVDRLGVQMHAARAGEKVIGWYAWLPHPRPFVRVMGADWRTCIGNLLEHYKRIAEDTPA